VAARLTDLDAPTVLHVKFSIFSNYRRQELGSLPSAYRGSLEGKGDLDLQMDLAVDGPLTKAALEQLCERLPAPEGATYQARMSVELEATEVAHEEQG
jgi:hypothetical protein